MKDEPMATNNLMTTKQVISYLSLNKITIYSLIKRRKNDPLPCFKVGRQWRFRKTEIDDWLEHNRGYKKSKA